MIGKFQTFQNHLPNQLTQNQDIITLQELKVLKVGWNLQENLKVSKVQAGIYVGVQGPGSGGESSHEGLGSQVWGQEFKQKSTWKSKGLARVGKSLHGSQRSRVWVWESKGLKSASKNPHKNPRFQECGWESMRGQRVPKLQTRVCMGIQGPKSGG